MVLMDASSDARRRAGDEIGKGQIYENMSSRFTSEVIDGFLVDPFAVTIEGANPSTSQRIARSTYQNGVECLVATSPDEKLSNPQLVERSKEIINRLRMEWRRFGELGRSGQFDGEGGIHEIIGKYATAQDAQSLGLLRQEFRQLAQQFPDVPENMNQTDLAAAREWQLQQNLSKPAEILFDFKLSEHFDPKDFEPGPIYMQLPNQKNDYK